MNLIFTQSWNEFYDGTNDSYQTGNFTDNHNYYICDVISVENPGFIDFVNNEETSIKILIESSLFHSNKKVYKIPDPNIPNGANIYINAKLNVIQNKICAYNCSVVGQGQHSYTDTKSNTTQYKNYFYLSSFSNSDKTTDSGVTTLYFGSSEVIVKNANVSNSITLLRCGLYFARTNFPGNASYTTLYNNKARNYYCILFDGFQEFSINKINILNNTMRDFLISTLKHDLLIEDSIVKDNNVLNTFEIGEGSSINIVHSTVEINGSYSNLNTQSSSTGEFQIGFTHFKPCNCCSSDVITKRKKLKYIKVLLNLMKIAR